MLLSRYHPRFVRPPNPSAQHLRCFARLEGDLSEVLPYLNARLQGHEFCPDPPSLTLKYRAKMITLTAHEIAINMVQDQDEAEEILEWLKQEINAAWEQRAEIVPRFEWPPNLASLKSLNSCPAPTVGPAASPPAWSSRCRRPRGRNLSRTVPTLRKKTTGNYENISDSFNCRINAGYLPGGV